MILIFCERSFLSSTDSPIAVKLHCSKVLVCDSFEASRGTSPSSGRTDKAPVVTIAGDAVFSSRCHLTSESDSAVPQSTSLRPSQSVYAVSPSRCHRLRSLSSHSWHSVSKQSAFCSRSRSIAASSTVAIGVARPIEITGNSSRPLPIFWSR